MLNSNSLDRAFQALADPARRQMLARLAGGSATVSELAQPLRMSLPAVLQHLKALEGLGAEVDVATPDLHGAADTLRKHWYAGAANLLQRFDGAAQAAMDPGLLEVAAEGRSYVLLEYLRAVAQREQLIVAANRFHQDYDLLVTPTLPIAAFAAGAEVPPGSAMKRWPDWTPFSYPFNLTQQPAISVPCGLTSDGLPAGLQIVGPRFADALVLRAARAYEKVKPWPFPDLAKSVKA